MQIKNHLCASIWFGFSAFLCSIVEFTHLWGNVFFIPQITFWFILIGIILGWVLGYKVLTSSFTKALGVGSLIGLLGFLIFILGFITYFSLESYLFCHAIHSCQQFFQGFWGSVWQMISISFLVSGWISVVLNMLAGCVLCLLARWVE